MKKKDSLAVKIISVVLACCLFASVFALTNSNFKSIFTGLFSAQNVGTEASDADESKNQSDSSNPDDIISQIPSDSVELVIDNSKPDYSTGDSQTGLTNLVFPYKSAYLDAGSSTRVRYTKAPEEADTSDLKWISSEPSVLVVSNLGKITAISSGSAVLTVYSEQYNVKASCTIYVKGGDDENNGEQIVIDKESDDETGFFTPPKDDDDDGPVNSTVHISSAGSSHTSSVKPSSGSSSASSSTSSKNPSNTTSHASSSTTSNSSSSSPSGTSSDKPSDVSSKTESTVHSDTQSTDSGSKTDFCDRLIKVRQGDGTFVVVSIIDYLVYNTGIEINCHFADEAVKAQAVAIYTYYIAYNMSGGASYASMEGSRCFKFNEDGSINFKTVKGNWPVADGSFDRLYELCREVAGQTVTYNGKAICAVFSATNRGASQCNSPYWSSRALPYLVSVDSPWDAECSDYKSIRKISKAVVAEELNSILQEGDVLPEDPSLWFFELTRDEPDVGYVLYVTIGNTTVSGGKVRSLFSFKSNCFIAEYDAETEMFTFTVYGNGHGIGLSQNGANGMAKAGSTWQQILGHYYTATKIQFVEPKYYTE